MSDDTKVPPAILVKNKQAQKGDVWGATSKQRFLKQHGTLDVHELPQSDAHSIKEYDDPTYVPPASPEETKAAESMLEKKINDLKNQGQTPAPPVTKKSKDGNFYDEWID